MAGIPPLQEFHHFPHNFPHFTDWSGRHRRALPRTSQNTSPLKVQWTVRMGKSTGVTVILQ